MHQGIEPSTVWLVDARLQPHNDFFFCLFQVGKWRVSVSGLDNHHLDTCCPDVVCPVKDANEQLDLSHWWLVISWWCFMWTQLCSAAVFTLTWAVSVHICPPHQHLSSSTSLLSTDWTFPVCEQQAAVLIVSCSATIYKPPLSFYCRPSPLPPSLPPCFLSSFSPWVSPSCPSHLLWTLSASCFNKDLYLLTETRTESSVWSSWLSLCLQTGTMWLLDSAFIL